MIAGYLQYWHWVLSLEIAAPQLGQ